MTDDNQLLERFATGGDEDSFRELIERHLDLVYSALSAWAPKSPGMSLFSS